MNLQPCVRLSPIFRNLKNSDTRVRDKNVRGVQKMLYCSTFHGFPVSALAWEGFCAEPLGAGARRPFRIPKGNPKGAPEIVAKLNRTVPRVRIFCPSVLSARSGWRVILINSVISELGGCEISPSPSGLLWSVSARELRRLLRKMANAALC